jgi:CPA1 family monovalent cation:H+ antiporter
MLHCSVGKIVTMPDMTVYFWLLLIASIVAMLGQRLRVPYALALVITGLVIGLPHLLPQAHLDPHLLFTVLLPPLLFEAAINLRLERLREHWRPIALYALGGTVLSAFIVGLLVAWLLHLPLLVALVFGALIAPTDPISVIAIFKRLGVDKRLSLLVEGESLFNDGIAVVLFTVLTGAVIQGTFSFSASLLQFIVTILGGAAVGVGIGALASRVT